MPPALTLEIALVESRATLLDGLAMIYDLRGCLPAAGEAGLAVRMLARILSA